VSGGRAKNRKPLARPRPQVGGASNRQHIATVETKTWSGPIPPPQTLEGYEMLVPGAADRILKVAEAQTAHRIDMESTVIRGDSKRSYLGLLAGFVLSTMVIAGGIYLVALGHDWAGAGLVGLNLTGLAAVFVYGSRLRQAALRREMTQPSAA